MKKRVTATLLGILMAGMTVNVQAAEENSLVVGNMGNSIKAAMVVLASEMGYYEEEGLDVEGMSSEELEDASEVFVLPGGRYLIVEG